MALSSVRSSFLVYFSSFERRASAWMLLVSLSAVAQGCVISSDTAHQTRSSAVVFSGEGLRDTTRSDQPDAAAPVSDSPSSAISFPPSPETPEASSPESESVAPPEKFVQTGMASWYGSRHHGRRTASGEIFNQKKLTAAHPTLPWGSIVSVTNLDNGKSVQVRINDRGPYEKGRIIDLSQAAAKAIGMIKSGVAQVQLELIFCPEKFKHFSVQTRK